MRPPYFEREPLPIRRMSAVDNGGSLPLKGSQLTDRQKEVIRLIAGGQGDKAIADRLGISRHTIRTHRGDIRTRLETSGEVGIVFGALEQGAFTPEDIVTPLVEEGRLNLSRFDALTDPETRVLEEMIRHLKDPAEPEIESGKKRAFRKEVASRLMLSPHTVRTHIDSIIKKTDIHDTSLVLLAFLVYKKDQNQRSIEQGEIIPRIRPGLEEILKLIAQGLNNREIAERLIFSEHTVKTYVSELLEVLGARSRAHAVFMGFKKGILTLDLDEKSENLAGGQ